MRPLKSTFVAFVLSLCAAQAVEVPPVNYDFLLFPSYDALDVFGPYEVLATLSRYTTTNIYFISKTLEPISQGLLNPAMNTHNSSTGFYMQPTHNFTHPPENLEVLLIPGGAGTRNPALGDVIEWVGSVYPSLKYLITVCTGAGVAARAGVLDGKRATTNKNAWNQTTMLRPQVEWVPRARWVADGNVWTTSGVSAGIDGTLDFVGTVYGRNYSQAIAQAMEYEAHTDADWDPFGEMLHTTWPLDTQ